MTILAWFLRKISTLRPVVARARRFASMCGGNVALMFGLAVMPLMGTIGYAIDYSRALAVKTTLTAAADSAALAAISPRNINPLLSQSAQDAASNAAANAMLAGTPVPFGTNLSDITTTVSRANGTVTVSIAYSATIDTTITRIFGIPSLSIGGTSAASSVSNRYIDIYVLVDSSTSMGIGASPTDQNIMQNTPGMDGGTGGCVVACHQSNTDVLARKNGAVLRFDVVKNAIGTMVNQAQAQSAGGNQIRFGVYSFANKFKTEIDISSTYGSITSAVNAMTLAQYDGGTNVAYALNTLRPKIATIGDGSSSATPLVFVLLMTDGTGNAVDNQPDGNWVYSSNFITYSPHSIADKANDPTMDLEGMNPAWCDQFKTANINMMTLETQYVIPAGMVGNELRFTYINNVLKPLMSANMQACASNPGFAYSANLPTDIQASIQKMFQSATRAQPRLVR